MSRAAIEAVIGPVEVLDRSLAAPTSPGQLPSHYAPRTPLFLLPEGGLPYAKPRGRAAALCASAASRALVEKGDSLQGHPPRFTRIVALAEDGDPVEAAANLFVRLHELDAAGFDEIWAERLPERGIGVAVNDRLYKASEKQGPN
jgi:L-threonylcarbamoyladenylate synthase